MTWVEENAHKVVGEQSIQLSSAFVNKCEEVFTLLLSSLRLRPVRK
jgi:hypothetical protein